MVEMYTFLGKENAPFQNVIFLDLYTMCMLMDIHQWIKWLIYSVTVEYPGGDVQLPGQGQRPLPQRDFPLLSAGGPGRLHHRQPHAGHRSVNHLLATGQSATCWPLISQPRAGHRSVNHMLATGQSTTCWAQVSPPHAGHRSVSHMLASQAHAGHRSVNHMLTWPQVSPPHAGLATGQSTTCWPQVSQLHAGHRSVFFPATVLVTTPNTLLQFSSVLDGISVLGKARIDSTPSLKSFPDIAFEIMPMFIWLMMALSRPFEENCLALPLSTPLSSHPQHRSKRVQNSTAGRCWGGDLTGW